MRKTILIFTFSILVLLGGCFTETIDQFSTFTMQLPLLFHSTHYNKKAPDTSFDFCNLFKYKEYRDNKDRIKTSMILQFNYWIDSLVYTDKDGNVYTFDPNNSSLPEVEFEFIRFSLHFAKPKIDGTDIAEVWDSSFYQFDYQQGKGSFLLGEFRDVNIKPYYRQANHIIEVKDDVAKIISEAINNQPIFYIITEYSPLKDQDIGTEPKRYFPYVAARYDMIIRFEIEL